MASLEDVERKQKAIQPLLEQIAHEEDANRVQELAKQIAAMAEELAQMTKGLEKAYAQPKGGSGQTRVVLTEGQRERVAEATGVPLETLVLDDAGKWDPQMPKMSPATIERLAMSSVAARKLEEEKRKAAKDILEQLETAMGSDPMPETKAALEQFKRDHLKE
jgi:hypothetical protein